MGDRLPPLHTTPTSITSDFIDPCWVLDRNRALSGIVEDVFFLQICLSLYRSLNISLSLSRINVFSH